LSPMSPPEKRSQASPIRVIGASVTNFSLFCVEIGRNPAPSERISVYFLDERLLKFHNPKRAALKLLFSVDFYLNGSKKPVT
ncbi:MAG: hypothetical protein KA152_03615, partial [Verrucomicrobiales bacterium]|nr:hypothetical protein [Verrucomicrobiales bacterium]